MSGTAALVDLYSALEETARRLDVPCSRDKVWPILTTYEDAIPEAVIAFRVATGARQAGEFNCHFMMLPGDVDPYALALSNDLTPKTDHPVGTLLAEIDERCPIDSHGIDFGVVGGFKKAWSIFPADDLQRLSTFAGLPSMPRSLAGHAEFFARYDLADRASLIGFDYGHKTVNVYFGTPSAEFLEPKNILSMIHDLGLPEPSERMLRLGQEAFGVYVTLSWDSSKIERFCFSIMTPDPMALPARLDPRIEQFARIVPYNAAGSKLVYAAISATEGEFYKIQSYYQWQSRTLSLMRLSDSAEGRV